MQPNIGYLKHIAYNVTLSLTNSWKGKYGYGSEPQSRAMRYCRQGHKIHKHVMLKRG